MDRRNSAETVALQALGWLAGQEDLWGVFLGATGASPSGVRARAEDPEFLASVLDFVLMDDAWVCAFAEDTGLAPEDVAPARAALPGGGLPHWT